MHNPIQYRIIRRENNIIGKLSASFKLKAFSPHKKPIWTMSPQPRGKVDLMGSVINQLKWN